MPEMDESPKPMERGVSPDREAALRKTLITIQKESLRYAENDMKPWEGQNWSALRVLLAKAVMSQYFESVMGVIIMSNLCLIVWETDQEAKCFPEFSGGSYQDCPTKSGAILWLANVNTALIILYSAEVAVRIFVERSLYLRNGWNQIDFFTVASAWFSSLMSFLPMNLSFLRILRLARLLRAVRVLISFREFYLLMAGFLSSMKAIFWGALLLLAVLGICAIFVVQLIHPINASIVYEGCTRCPNGFSSVFDALVTLFQEIVAGDSWGQISLPVIEHAPWTAPLLFSMVIVISLGVMNLILSVIVEQASEARENDQIEKARMKEKERVRSMMEVAEICHSIDDDASGTLSMDEMLNGIESMSQFKEFMIKTDLRKEDMLTIFNVLDERNEQEVSYLELCQKLDDATKRDPALVSSLVKFSVDELKKIIRDEVMATLEQHTSMLESLGCTPVEKGLKKDRPDRTDSSSEVSDAIAEMAHIPASREAFLPRSMSALHEELMRLSKVFEAENLQLGELLLEAEAEVERLRLQSTSFGSGPVKVGTLTTEKETESQKKHQSFAKDLRSLQRSISHNLEAESKVLGRSEDVLRELEAHREKAHRKGYS
mmetsp:Transcript_22163/g.39852  ORF Transcript_22163/g.39852 Transcript_22163/m.39852 type:complete len:604 (+) Transcript_22163:48-1859(+)|eukprot:CAMPEP_0197628732 /NCGR_PEP_ID=MMETSP1338-20131121/6905_1 /TAXON_ID=43686 ORGANISM="Pelagodinium beii, Strain RCC1491" /NCGR_SAMPLE_ID=MMETSP1338 /ASSEMBLY_ACC=CAM_ASM_000754 /LENGTH=603 /DNA_ID=CAMNT_0043199725 /DNA_START=41 /DNA_END=1852 /DNA_ORIENTATION=-